MQKSEFQKIWKQYEPLIEAVVELFHPFVEVAVHDLERGTLAQIFNCISKRTVGEASPLKELGVKVEDFPDYFPPYYKQNFKCTSITLRNVKGKPVGLICINVDTSYFQESLALLTTFLKTNKTGENPIEIFGGSCESQTAAFIEQYLDEKRLSLSRLNRDQKKELVLHLYRKGIFNYKNAVPFIAQKLNISRATIYNHIK